MGPPPNPTSISIFDKYQDTFLGTHEFDPTGFYQPTFTLFAQQDIGGIPIHLFPEYIHLRTGRLWKPPLNPVKRLTDPLKDILKTIAEVYELREKADRIPGHAIEKRYLEHTLWYNQLVWLDISNRLTTYTKTVLGPEATVRDMIDQWDHPSTAWSEHYVLFFELALGYEKDNAMEVWEFGDNLQDLIKTCEMLVVDVKEYLLSSQAVELARYY